MTQMRSMGTAVIVERSAAPSLDALAAWDALVEGTPGTDVTQLSAWARVRSFEDFDAEYLFAHCGGRLIGGAQVLTRRIRGLGRIGYLSYGPVVAENGSDDAPEVVALLVHELARLPRVRMLFIQPPEGGEDSRRALLSCGFRPSSAGIAPAGSVRVDLHRSVDEIRRGLSPRLRSWTHRWADAGVTVRRGSVADVPLLTVLMQAAADARGYGRPPTEQYLRHLYDELAATGHVAMFVGEIDGIPVSADIVTMCGATVRGRFSGFDRAGPGRRLSVPGAARWTIMMWARAAGYRWLDFGGLSRQTLDDLLDRGIRHDEAWPGPDRAKLQFGGTAFRYPEAVERLTPAPLRVSYDALSRSPWGAAQLHRAKVALRSRASTRPTRRGASR